MTIRAHFDGKVFVPVDRVDLPKDQLVELDVKDALKPGTPQAVLELMDRFAKLSRDGVDELEKSIQESKLPANTSGVFDDDAE